MSLLMISRDENDRASTGVLEKLLFVVVIFVEFSALFQSILVRKKFRTIHCPAPLYRSNSRCCTCDIRCARSEFPYFVS